MKRIKETPDIIADTTEDGGIVAELLKKLEAPSVDFLDAVKNRDLPRWRVVRYLPVVLFCLHMVFEVMPLPHSWFLIYYCFLE